MCTSLPHQHPSLPMCTNSLGLVGPLLGVRLQMALHPDTERAAAHFAASEAANDGRRLLGGNKGAVGGFAGPIQDNPMLDILQVSRPIGCGLDMKTQSFSHMFNLLCTLHPRGQGAHERLYSRLFIS